ncbi:MAG TPA: hypothetical protein VF230_18725 [Acidimicrobiales bacterium]
MSRSAKQALAGLGAMLLVLVAIVLIAMRGSAENGLRADVLSTRRAEPGEKVDITISTRDDFGVVTGVRVDFGDGNLADPVRKEPTGCRSEFARAEEFDYTHTYTGEGPFTVRATVTSGGCGAPSERVVAIRTISVKPRRS